MRIQAKKNLKSIQSVADYFFAKQTDKNAPSEFESNQKNLQAQVILPNSAISQKTSLKYLGVHFDEKVTFNRQILELCEKLSNFSGLFYKLR